MLALDEMLVENTVDVKYSGRDIDEVLLHTLYYLHAVLLVSLEIMVVQPCKSLTKAARSKVIVHDIFDICCHEMV